MTKSTELYDRLGVSSNATADEIKAGYRRAVKTCHPDLHPDNEEKAQEFRNIQTAFDVLSDPEKRKLYDETGIADAADQQTKLTAEALDNLTMLFGQVAEQLEDPDNQSPLEAVRTQLNHKAQLYAHSRQNILERTRRLEIVKKRLKRKTAEPNPFGNALNHKLEHLASELRACEQTQKVLQIMAQLLAEYTYTLEPKDPTRGSFGPGFGMNLTGNSTNGFR